MQKCSNWFDSSREFEAAATKILVAHGCTSEGRRVEDVDPRQVAFEQRVAYCSLGDRRDWY